MKYNTLLRAMKEKRSERWNEFMKALSVYRSSDPLNTEQILERRLPYILNVKELWPEVNAKENGKEWTFIAVSLMIDKWDFAALNWDYDADCESCGLLVPLEWPAEKVKYCTWCHQINKKLDDEFRLEALVEEAKENARKIVEIVLKSQEKLDLK